MKVLVTGGAGYIGSHTVYALIESGIEVVVADNLTKGHENALHPDALFYYGDICDKSFINGLLERERVDGVIHFAAVSLVGESVFEPAKYYDMNFGGTRTLVGAMLENGVSKLVFSSTAAVYGESDTVYGESNSVPITEEYPTQPGSPYGETKLAVEGMLKWFSRAYGLSYASLRYFNAAGAHENGLIGEQHEPETHLIPIIMQVLGGKRERLEIYGNDYPTPDKTCIRDYIHVSDLADAHILAMNHLMNGGESGVYNLGNGEGFSVLEIINAVERVTGKAVAREFSERRPGDPARLVASAEKAKKELGWNPTRSSIENIIKTAYDFHIGAVI